MKKFMCILMALVICLSLCACGSKVINDNGVKVHTFVDEYGIISHDWEYNYYVVYHLQSKVVYIYKEGFTPYQIYENGVIYGAIYENGEIVPVPYALGITDEMIEDQFSNWFG